MSGSAIRERPDFLGGQADEEAAAKVDRDWWAKNPRAVHWSPLSEASFADEDALQRPYETDIGEITGRQLLRSSILDLAWHAGSSGDRDERVSGCCVGEEHLAQIEPIVPTIDRWESSGTNQWKIADVLLQLKLLDALAAAHSGEGVRDDGQMSVMRHAAERRSTPST